MKVIIGTIEAFNRDTGEQGWHFAKAWRRPMLPDNDPFWGHPHGDEPNTFANRMRTELLDGLNARLVEWKLDPVTVADIENGDVLWQTEGVELEEGF